MRCKALLQHYFHATFPEAAKVAEPEVHSADRAPGYPRSESPDSVMDTYS